MKTVQMTLDENLVQAVDQAVGELHTTRSAFTRDALRRALEELKLARLERRHRQGYEARPVAGSEFSVWENEQEWGEQ